jgi:hypothetical protein
VAAKLADPAIPLFIIEGCKKANCGALHDLCIVDLIVSGSGAAKTETITPLGNCDGAVTVSTISSEGAFLSASGKHERSADAPGGCCARWGTAASCYAKTSRRFWR